MKPSLRFQTKDIAVIASRYAYAQGDMTSLPARSEVLKRGYLTKRQLQTIVGWKAPRIARHVLANPPDFVRESTRFALQTRSERARIESLRLLDGVSWPIASVILHV